MALKIINKLFPYCMLFMLSFPAFSVTICHREGGGETTVNEAMSAHISHPFDTLGACTVISDSSTPSSDSGTIASADSGEVEEYIINNCEGVQRENLCNVIYPVEPDSSVLDDPDSSGVIDYSGTADDCASFDFSNDRKLTICHNGRTINVATQGACNGHFPQHAGDTLGACFNTADSGAVSAADSGTISDNEQCADDTSALVITASQLADSGVYNEIYDCVGDPSDPDDPTTNTNIVPVPGSGSGGRFNWRELF